MTIETAKVSVVLPVYNGQAFVADAIESALAQSHRCVEVIAVEDGSEDRSIEILKRYEDRITIVSQENTGVAGARNAGLENASGQFVAFLDQDDWWLPEKLSLQLATFAANPAIGLVHTAVEHIDAATGRRTEPLDPDARPESMVGRCFDRLLLGNPIYNSSVMVRRAVLQEVGGCDGQIAGNTVADYDLWLRIAKHYEFGFVSQPVTCYRMHADQGMHNRNCMLEAELKVLLRTRDERDWCRIADGRLRLANLYDQLAVAWYDQGETAIARRYFAHAAWIAKSKRACARWAVSLLPRTIVSRLRHS